MIFPPAGSMLKAETKEVAVPNLGPTEMIFILVVVLLVFGAGRLPEVGRSLGKSITEFKHGLTGGDDKPSVASTQTPVQPPAALPPDRGEAGPRSV